MKISKHWLKEWVKTNLPAIKISNILTMAGLEVDAIEKAAPDFTNVIIGEILTAEKHPEAKKLQICTVKYSEHEPTLQIICGASNARANLKVALARDGAKLPNDFDIKISTIRGVESFGMLCSASELGLAEKSEGIIELAADAPLGQSFREYYDLDDEIIEIDLTPNRGDCFSIQGVSRELSALTQSEWTPVTINAIPPHLEDKLEVYLKAPEACPCYCGRIIKNINAKAKTPLWMQEKLRRSGLRSIHPVVDITNYVMLELGQPLHAFDLTKITGNIQVRFAQEKEKITLLDEKELTLSSNDLVIADDTQALALAGIMGGLSSSVTEHTQHLFLEAAFFNPLTMAGKARNHGLHTDASLRFERGVDFALPRQAIERMSALLLEIVGGEAGPITEAVIPEQLPKRTTIHLYHKNIKRILGLEITPSQIETYLQSLQCQLITQEDSWKVMPPSFRYDIVIERDLIEEIARLYGYDNIPGTSPPAYLKLQPESEAKLGLDQLRQALIAKDYQEAITYSFIDPLLQALFLPYTKAIEITNPISSEMGVMRLSLIPGLIKAAEHNLNRQQERIRLFEIGRCFEPNDVDKIIEQPLTLAGIATGKLYPEQWGLANRKIDFFDIKADLEALLGLTQAKLEFVAEMHPFLHPGQSATIFLNDKKVGWLGMLHPQLQTKLDLDHEFFCFNINILEINFSKLPKYTALSIYPMINRDISLIVAEEIPTETISTCIYSAAPDIIQLVTLFDLYQGENIQTGHKSLAYSIYLQSKEKTLVEEEVETIMKTIRETLENQFKAQLRS